MMGNMSGGSENSSVDVRLAEIQGALQTMNAAITERLNHLADKMGTGAADLNTHVHHSNPHTEQEDWLRRLIDSRYENLTRLLDLHAQENDRDFLSSRQDCAQRFRELEQAQKIVQQRTDQQDGAIKILRYLSGALVAIAAGSGGTILYQIANHR